MYLPPFLSISYWFHFSGTLIQLTLEQHRFELRKSTHMWIFFSKYIGRQALPEASGWAQSLPGPLRLGLSHLRMDPTEMHNLSSQYFVPFLDTMPRQAEMWPGSKWRQHLLTPCIHCPYPKWYSTKFLKR